MAYKGISCFSKYILRYRMLASTMEALCLPEGAPFPSSTQDFNMKVSIVSDFLSLLINVNPM
jgi:hypothetical protein